MEDCWPSGAALRGEASKYLKLHWLTTVVVSVEEKTSSMTSTGDRKGEHCSPLMKHRKLWVASEPGCRRCPGMSLADTPFTGQAVPGVKAARVRSAASIRNVREHAPTLPREWCWARGRAPSGGNREALSTVAGREVGPVHSSDEVPVTGAERRGRTVR